MLLQQRREHHEARFHQDLKDIQGAVELLNLLVGGSRGSSDDGDATAEAEDRGRRR